MLHLVGFWYHFTGDEQSQKRQANFHVSVPSNAVWLGNKYVIFNDCYLLCVILYCYDSCAILLFDRFLSSLLPALNCYCTSRIFFGFFFRTSAKLQKSDCFLLQVCLTSWQFICLCNSIEHHRSQWTDFHEIWYLSIFRKYAEKIEFSLTLIVLMWRIGWAHNNARK